MTARDDAIAALDKAIAQGQTDGAASRDAEVAALKKQVADLQAAAAAPKSRTVLDASFADVPDGPCTLAILKTKFPGITGPPDSYYASHRMTFKGGALVIGMPANNMDRTVWFWTMPEELTAATLYQEIEFASGFDFSGGGKVGWGLGGTDTASIDPPTGGKAPTNGHSFRPMWRTQGNGGRPPGSAEVYTYHQDQAGHWGDDVYLEQPFVVGQNAKMYGSMKLNDVGAANGTLKAYLEGTGGVSLSNYTWRSAEAQKINRYGFATFRGGATTEPQIWASTKAGSILFRRVKITTP